MNYVEWADEYFRNALSVRNVMEKKKGLLKGRMSADERKKLSDEIKAYRVIYHELTAIGDTLLDRAGR